MIKHTFHVPVMGIGYTIDSPLRLAPYGIDSVISLVDDSLIERFRMLYCEKFQIPYHEITSRAHDFRAQRITAYLDLLGEMAEKKLEEMKSFASSAAKDLRDYFDMLPCQSEIKEEFKSLSEKYFDTNSIKAWLNKHMHLGSIDVNIMTKVDKDNYRKGEKLPTEFNDAHAALRGFANSKLNSSVILSAGMNPRLYGYFEQFDDFYPNQDGSFQKKIVLKVSDYRSAVIQGKFFAKKGLWVSEYRIESGLNCGGHAFATDGHLLGPILAEFRDNREELRKTVFEILQKALIQKERVLPNKTPDLKITAQGGVGTAEEHLFLLNHYAVDSVGWGTPFMLVPEVVNIDNETLEKLQLAKESDLYLSNISPLGVPFNSLKGNTKDIEKQELIDKGKPGSSCPKQYVALSGEFTDKPICAASSQYQKLKIAHLKQQNLSENQYQEALKATLEKSCICVGLGTSALIVNNLDTKNEGTGISVCPGPNMAYFDKKISLKEMVDHIYGRINVITRTDRPNMFIKELELYLQFIQEKVEKSLNSREEINYKYFKQFFLNICEGINYYQNMFNEVKEYFSAEKEQIQHKLEEVATKLNVLKLSILPNSTDGPSISCHKTRG